MDPISVTIDRSPIQVEVGNRGIKGDVGDSAYQVWLDAGNVGTVNDYLASLKGAPGTAGTGIVTTRGDVLVATGVGVVARHGVGADGTVLVADSTQADGVGWEVTAPPLPTGWLIVPRVSGRSTQILTSGGIGPYGTWLEVAADLHPISGIAWEVTTPGDSTSSIAAALYRPRFPSSASVDRVALTGTVSAAAIGVKTGAAAVTLRRGMYLAIIAPSGQTTTFPTVRTVSAVSTGIAYPLTGDNLDFTSDPRNGLSAQTALAAAAGLPASFALAAQGTRMFGPLIGLVTA
jgi:hypothetical protein